jgi:beta-glucanase (GH16 family)
MIGLPAMAAAMSDANAVTARPSGGSTLGPSPEPSATAPAAVPVRDLSTAIWRDEFDGPAGSTVDHRLWTVRTGAGGWGNGELQAYSSSTDNVSVDGQGNLRLTMRREDTVDAAGNRARFTSGRIESRVPVDAGRLEARIQFPSGVGLWPAFWTVGADCPTAGWPKCGEIDIAESWNDGTVVDAVAHGAVLDSAGRPTTAEWRDKQSTPITSSGADGAWHVYAVDLLGDRLVFSVDGQVHLEVLRSERSATEDWPFDQPQTMVLDLAMSGGLPAGQVPPLPATLLVDYVRAYPRA